MSKINLNKSTVSNSKQVDLNQLARKVVGAIFFTYFTYSIVAFIGWFFDLWWKMGHPFSTIEEHPLVTLIIGGILSTVVIFVMTAVVGLTAVIFCVDLFRWVVFDKKFEYTRELFRGN